MNWRHYARLAGRTLLRLAGSESHILFFLGAGVSRPSCFPLAKDISGYVFEDELEWYGPEPGYYGPPCDAEEGGKGLERTKQVRAFLKVLQKTAQAYFDERFENENTGASKRTVNYEDIYFLSNQIVGNEEGQSRDPTAGLLAESVRQEASAHLLSDPDNQKSNLRYTASQGMRLIRSVLRNHLDRRVEEIKGLGLLFDAVRSEDYDRVTIVTLNHDLLIEEYFKQKDIDYEDGFGRPVCDTRPYEPERLFDASAKVRIIKPHGSINWYLADPPRSELEYVATTGPSPYNPHEKEICRRYAIDDASLPILLSSQGKESNYGKDIFSDMMLAFLTALHDAEVVVVSGFGWNDIGMRDRLLAALERRQAKRLVLLYERMDGWGIGELHFFHIKSLEKREQYAWHRKWLCDTSWHELQQAIAQNKSAASHK